MRIASKFAEVDRALFRALHHPQLHVPIILSSLMRMLFSSGLGRGLVTFGHAYSGLNAGPVTAGELCDDWQRLGLVKFGLLAS